MLMDDIKLWAVDGSNGAVPVAAADRMESERLLEETLVDNPDLLMPGLTIVGRQAPTDGARWTFSAWTRTAGSWYSN